MRLFLIITGTAFILSSCTQPIFMSTQEAHQEYARINNISPFEILVINEPKAFRNYIIPSDLVTIRTKGGEFLRFRITEVRENNLAGEMNVINYGDISGIKIYRYKNVDRLKVDDSEDENRDDFPGPNSPVEEKINIVQINSLALLVGSINIFYEHQISINKSLGFVINYYNKKDLHFFLTYSEFDLKKIGFTIDYKIYQREMEGYYLGPYLKYMFAEKTERDDDFIPALVTNEKVNNFGFGVIAGYQKIGETGLVLDMFIGIGYNPIIFDSGDPEVIDGNFRVDPRLGVKLGFIF